MIPKSTDWSPKYHKTARKFPWFFCTPHSMNKLTLNEPAIKGSDEFQIGGSWLYVLASCSLPDFMSPSPILNSFYEAFLLQKKLSF